VTGTTVGSTFDDVRRALARTLDTSTSLDGGAGRQSVGGGGEIAMLGTAAAFPGDDDRQLLRDLQGRRTSATAGEIRQQRPSPTSPTAAAPPPQVQQQQQQPQLQQQRVEVRRVRRQMSESPATSPDGPDAAGVPAPTVSTSVGRLHAVEQFRRNEAKRASLISHTSSVVSSDGTINVVTDSEDEDDQRPPATTLSRQQLPSPSSRSATTPGSPTGNGVLPSPTDARPLVAAAAHNGRESSLSPQRDVTSASGASSQPSKCWCGSVCVFSGPIP